MNAAPADYRLYGLTLRSSWALPCPRVERRGRVDVRLTAGSSERFARARRDIPAPSPNSWFQWRPLASGVTFLRWPDLFEFLVSADGRRVEYYRLKHATRESFNVYLVGQVLSFSLLALGREPLHGTVVVVDGKAIAFVGDCGSGKSTLAAAFLARGYPVLTDDLVALEESDIGWNVHPGIPRIKLFPSVARRWRGSNVTCTPMNNGTSKLVVPLRPSETVRHVVPLAAMYVLSDARQRGGREGNRIRAHDLRGAEAFLEVIRAAFNLSVLKRERLANQFDFANRLVTNVPIRRLIYPRSLSRLSEVCDTVLADFMN